MSTIAKVISRRVFLGVLFLCATFIMLITPAETAGRAPPRREQGTQLYRVRLVNNKGRTIGVWRQGKRLMLEVKGFGPTRWLWVNSGGVATCRTALLHDATLHNPDGNEVLLSLPIPRPGHKCRMTPPFAMIRLRAQHVNLPDAAIKKVWGNDALLRRAVQKILGEAAG